MTTAVQITPTQTAAASFILETANYPRVVIFATGLGDGEPLNVEIVAPNGAFFACRDVNGDPGMMTGDDAAKTFIGGPTYVVSKPVTAGASAAFFIPSVQP